MTRIVLDHLSKHYGPVRAVNDLSVTVRPGLVTGFVGANGAGKSTTIRMLLGLTRPSAGTATLDGKPYVDLPHPTRTVGALTDPHVFHPRRSGRNALRVLARAGGVRARRVDEVLDLVDLDAAARRRVGGYSTGMRQRLGLAAALLGDPETLVLDEPANGLDPTGVRWLRQTLRGLAAEGRTVLVSSHQLAELANTVDDVVVVDHGRLVVQGPMDALLASSDAPTLEDLFFGLISKGDRS